MPTALELFQDKEKYIDASITGLSKQVHTIQRHLLTLILDEYISGFTFDEAGNIANTSANILRAAELDNIFDAWNETYQQSVIKDFTNKTLKLTTFNKQYFEALDKTFKEEILEAVPVMQKNVLATLGLKEVTRDGEKVIETIKGGYIDNLQRNDVVKNEIKNYVVNSVNNNTGLQNYIDGFKDILQKDGGKLEKYYRTYAYDTFNQVDRISGSFIADKLGLNYFVYEGSLIKTSRPFCCKRAFKVFHKLDLNSWKCDVDLIGKPKGVECDDTYRPIIELGRWQCRHSARWISDELANDMGIMHSEDIIKKSGSPECPDKKK